MTKSSNTILKSLFLGILTLISIINISCGQSKIDKIDKLISTYSEYGKFNGSVLIAEKGEVINNYDNIFFGDLVVIKYIADHIIIL